MDHWTEALIAGICGVGIITCIVAVAIQEPPNELRLEVQQVEEIEKVGDCLHLYLKGDRIESFCEKIEIEEE